MNKLDDVAAQSRDQLAYIEKFTQEKQLEVASIFERNQQQLNNLEPFQKASEIENQVTEMMDSVSQELASAMKAISQQITDYSPTD